MPALIREIERVIFEAHSPLDRDGSIDFQELLERRAGQFRDARMREEMALASISDQIGIELDKTRQVALLRTQITDKEKLIARYEGDRKNLLPKGPNKTAERLQELVAAAEKVRGYLRYFANQQASLSGLKNEVRDLRLNKAPETLRVMKDRYQRSNIEATDWDGFLLKYSGDVDRVVEAKEADAQKSANSWKGATPTRACLQLRRMAAQAR
jgi:hypothetical protein